MVIEHALTAELESLATAAGAAGFGVTGSDVLIEARSALHRRKAAGMAGPLHFTYDDPDMATDVTVSFPWARSLVSVAAAYGADASGPAGTGPLVARFATRDHYREVRRMVAEIQRALTERGHRSEALIDDNRMADRAVAARSGVGWIGKSTMILTPGHGPWLLLGTVATDARLTPTTAMRRNCGTCVACVPACPTGAITPDGLDAGRCISTWLQAPGSLPLWIRPHIGRRIYGCDDCLTSCPPGSRALGRRVIEYSFEDLLARDDEALLERFHWWYVPRRDGRFIRRNLLVAAGNSGEPEAVPHLLAHLQHPSSLIRGHAAWAVARLLGEHARTHLDAALESETVAEPRSEIQNALLMIDGTTR